MTISTPQLFLLKSPLTSNQVCIILNGTRPTCQIALQLIAALLEQERMLRICLNAFAKDGNIEAMAQIDDSTDNGDGAAVQVPDKRAVDLDLVEVKRVQIGQGGVSGSEIIQSDFYAKRFQPIENRHRMRKIVNEHPFGDFEFEPSRSKTGFEED